MKNELGWDKWLQNGSFTLFKTSIIQEQFIQCIIDNVPKNNKILETGFGFGTTLELLRDFGYNVFGFDLEEIAVKNSEEKYPKLSGQLYVGNILEEGSYRNDIDTIIHQGVLEHFNDEEIIKILEIQMNNCRQIIFDVPNSMRKIKEDEGDNTRFESPEFWENIIKKAGFKFERFGRTYDYGDEYLPSNLKRYDSDLMKKLGRSSIFIVKK